MIQFGPVITGPGNCLFSVWAPEMETMFLHLVHPGDEIIEMQKGEKGYFITEVKNTGHGTRYFYKPEGFLLRPSLQYLFFTIPCYLNCCQLLI